MANPYVSVLNLGCRVNRVESDRITSDLARAGYTFVDPDDADLIVINTCAVTGEAEAKTRKAVRHALARKREPFVVATGCAANLHPEALRELSDRVIVEPSKVSVVERVSEVLGFEVENEDVFDAHDLADLLGRSRLGVKIQDGCNHRCTYCIVWKARGPERSVPVSSVLEQVQEACDAKIPEIVLTGVNLGAYDGVSDRDTHVELDELLETILIETDIPHVRISSIEPMDLSDRLIDVMSSYPDRVAPFLHLPVQSGCTATLKRMNRPYTAEEFETLVANVRRQLPAVSLSCDIIVGFPGETEDEFRKSYDLCERVGFSRMHVFRYSARPDTPAARMSDQVDPHVMAERSALMRELAQRMARADAELRIGTVEQAILENECYATLGSFHRAVVDGVEPDLPTQRFACTIQSVDESGLVHVVPAGQMLPRG